MEEYVQSSLKYRPQFFRDVLGQPAVVRVLQNSVKFSKISSAYLFAGQRGTGKTSVARVFARLINCDNPVDYEPCGNCPSCENIKGCKDPNVMELDAATHGLKEDVTELQKMAAQLPYPGKKKIFILDECHAMSRAGQQAFLKLLEEPPKNVIFILVTTEPTKLEDTILSRCFRLDFRAIPIPEIEKSIRTIFRDNQVECPESVIRMLMNNTDGSLRDMQQIADQLVGMASQGTLDEDIVSDLLGYLTMDQYRELAALICSEDFGEWVDGIADMFYSGVDLEFVLSKSLQLLLRDFRCSLCCGPDWEYLTGISYESFEKNMPFEERHLDVFQQALEDALKQRNMGCPPRLSLEIFYAKFLDEIRFYQSQE